MDWSEITEILQKVWDLPPDALKLACTGLIIILAVKALTGIAFDVKIDARISNQPLETKKQ